PCQVVVVDYLSTDATPEIAARLADRVVLGPDPAQLGAARRRPVAAHRNLGAAHADAHILAFIDADMLLEPTVLAEAAAQVRAGAGAVVIPERTVGTGFWTSVRALERSFYVGSGIEYARVFGRTVFDHLGGFDA